MVFVFFVTLVPISGIHHQLMLSKSLPFCRFRQNRNNSMIDDYNSIQFFFLLHYFFFIYMFLVTMKCKLLFVFFLFSVLYPLYLRVTQLLKRNNNHLCKYSRGLKKNSWLDLLWPLLRTSLSRTWGIWPMISKRRPSTIRHFEFHDFSKTPRIIIM